MQKKQKGTCNTSRSAFDVKILKREAKVTTSDFENNDNEKSTKDDELVVNEMSDDETIRLQKANNPCFHE